MREPQARLTNIPKEFERANAQDAVGNPAAVSELAVCLFDLRAAHEAELRTLTWIQRTLDTIRAGRGGCGDVELLFREMTRLIKESDGAATALATHRKFAVELLAAATGEADTSARDPRPLAIVAA
jgi:hypothetical protein